MADEDATQYCVCQQVDSGACALRRGAVRVRVEEAAYAAD